MAGISYSERNELVEWMFEKHYEVIIAPIYVDAIDERPISIRKAAVPYNDYHAGVVHSVENPNADILMDAMFGRTKYTGDADKDKAIANQPVDKLITPVEMAEVLNIGGKFILRNMNDSTEIVEKLARYVNGIEEQAIVEPFYRKPPDEDLKKLEHLLNAMDPLADRLNLLGLGKGIWSELMKALDIKGVYAVGGDNGDFSIDRKPSTPANTPVPEASKDPYRF